jgi:hypothetical protein
MGGYIAGQEQARRDAEPLPPRQQWKTSEYFGALIGAPIVVGVIAGVWSLLAGGDYVQWALRSGGAVFGIILVIGLLHLAVRLLVVLAPLVGLVALALYVLDRMGIGPGLPSH